jgi:hypothetical protein
MLSFYLPVTSRCPSYSVLNAEFGIFGLEYRSKLRFLSLLFSPSNESTWRIWTNHYWSYVGGNLLGASTRSLQAMDEEHDQSYFRMGRLLDFIDLGNSFFKTP